MSDRSAARERLSWAPWLGLLAGVSVGLTDVLAFRALGVEYVWDGESAVGWMIAVFGGTYAWLGWLVGRLLQQRARLRRQRDVIGAQLAELERHGERLAQAERLAAIGSMAAGVAHEVRNPLGVMRSSALLLGEDLDPGGDGARAATFIVEEVDRLDAFVGQLLDYARPLSPRCAPVAVRELARAAGHRASEQLAAAEAALEIELDEDLAVSGDRDLLVGVLVTGLINAAQAIERDERGVDRRVVVRVRPGGAERLVIEVADSGPGVEDGMVDRAFEPFVTSRARGTGLGLAMVQRIVEAHDGEVALVRGRGLGEDGRGACLCIELPMAYPHAAPGAASSARGTLHQVTA